LFLSHYKTVVNIFSLLSISRITYDCYFIAAKFGVEPAQWVDLVKHITNCPNLEFCGLMTIGMLDYSSTPENFKVATIHFGHDLLLFSGLPI